MTSKLGNIKPHQKVLLKAVGIEILLIPVIILTFKFVPKPYAGLVASTIFLFFTFNLLALLFKEHRLRKSFSMLGASVFLFTAVIPLFVIGSLFFIIPFDQFKIGPFTGPGLHAYSEKLFIVLLICHVADYFYKKSENLVDSEAG